MCGSLRKDNMKNEKAIKAQLKSFTNTSLFSFYNTLPSFSFKAHNHVMWLDRGSKLLFELQVLCVREKFCPLGEGGGVGGVAQWVFV